MNATRLVALAVIAIATGSAMTRTVSAVEARGAITAQSVPSGARAVDPSTSEPGEAQALKLVRDELPALQKVIDRLRADSPTQYEKAVREIGRSAKRLEAVRLRDEQLYRLELDLLRSRTTISLLVARLKVRDDESDRSALKATVKQLHQAEWSRAKYDVETMQKRLQKMNDQLVQAQSRLDKKSGDANEYERDVYADYLRKAGRDMESSTQKKRSREKGKTE